MDTNSRTAPSDHNNILYSFPRAQLLPAIGLQHSQHIRWKIYTTLKDITKLITTYTTTCQSQTTIILQTTMRSLQKSTTMPTSLDHINHPRLKSMTWAIMLLKSTISHSSRTTTKATTFPFLDLIMHTDLILIRLGNTAMRPITRHPHNPHLHRSPSGGGRQ